MCPISKHTRISYILYQALKMQENVTSKWILNVKRILCDIGRHNLWLHQTEIGSYSTRYLVKQTFKDHLLQQSLFSSLSLVGVVAGSSMNGTALMARAYSNCANAQAVWIFARFERRSFYKRNQTLFFTDNNSILVVHLCGNILFLCLIIRENAAFSNFNNYVTTFTHCQSKLIFSRRSHAILLTSKVITEVAHR